MYYPANENSNPYIDIYKVIKSWANSKDYDLTFEEAFRTKKQKEKLSKLLEKHPIFKEFMPWSKNKLLQRGGVWIPV